MDHDKINEELVNIKQVLINSSKSSHKLFNVMIENQKKLAKEIRNGTNSPKSKKHDCRSTNSDAVLIDSIQNLNKTMNKIMNILVFEIPEHNEENSSENSLRRQETLLEVMINLHNETHTRKDIFNQKFEHLLKEVYNSMQGLEILLKKLYKDVIDIRQNAINEKAFELNEEEWKKHEWYYTWKKRWYHIWKWVVPIMYLIFGGVLTSIYCGCFIPDQRSAATLYYILTFFAEAVRQARGSCPMVKPKEDSATDPSLGNGEG